METYCADFRNIDLKKISSPLTCPVSMRISPAGRVKPYIVASALDALIHFP
jgi:hypothetical protein